MNTEQILQWYGLGVTIALGLFGLVITCLKKWGDYRRGEYLQWRDVYEHDTPPRANARKRTSSEESSGDERQS
jgi:hypothetical protein